MSQPTDLGDNSLLAALPQEDAARLSPHLEPVTWSLRTVLYDPDCAPAFLYFPTTATVSLISTSVSGRTAATGVVGCEGVVGVALVMGGASRPGQAMVQMAGSGFQLPAAIGHAEFERGGAFQATLLRYTQALLTQTAQTAVCNRMHAIAQRLCRWLLLIHDRVPTTPCHPWCARAVTPIPPVAGQTTPRSRPLIAFGDRAVPPLWGRWIQEQV
jgi:hypothetical protein